MKYLNEISNQNKVRNNNDNKLDARQVFSTNNNRTCGSDDDKLKDDIRNMAEIDLTDDDNSESYDDIDAFDTDESSQSSERSRERLRAFCDVQSSEDINNGTMKQALKNNVLGKFREMDKLFQRYKGDISKSVQNTLSILPTIIPSNLALLEGEKEKKIHNNREEEEEIYVDPEDKGIYREVLWAFYKKYNPDKIGEVDYLLEFYHGKEELLFGRIETAYHLKFFQPALVALYTVRNPDKLDTIVEKFQDKKAEIDVEDTEIYREALNVFYKEYKPKKVANVDTLLEYYHGKEQVLFGRIETVYQVNPFRPALVAFYTIHDPQKLKNVDLILKGFKGEECKIFKHIKAKYPLSQLPI